MDALADGAPEGQGEHAAARARFVDDAIGGGEPPVALAAGWFRLRIRSLMYPDTACRLLAGGGGGDDGLAAINFRERAVLRMVTRRPFALCVAAAGLVTSTLLTWY